MNKAVLSILIGTLAGLTGGCSLFADSNQESENAVRPVPIQVKTQQQTEPEEFADLKEVEPVEEIAGLIPATNPEVRVRSSVRGRNDPFSVVTLNPRIEIEPQETPDPPANRNDRPNRTQNTPDRTASNPSFMPVPEPPPNPALAQDVVITGLYQANGRTRLIVQAPEEENSRYVEVGDYLSNGRVLVKSIDTSQYPPLVILEQSGIEVAKVIGEDSASEEVSFLPPVNSEARYRASNISFSSN